MAPEILNGGTPSPASDVYVFAMFLSELMTRTRPYGAKTVHSLPVDELSEISLAANCFAAGNFESNKGRKRKLVLGHGADENVSTTG